MIVGDPKGIYEIVDKTNVTFGLFRTTERQLRRSMLFAKTDEARGRWASNMSRYLVQRTGYLLFPCGGLNQRRSSLRAKHGAGSPNTGRFAARDRGCPYTIVLRIPRGALTFCESRAARPDIELSIKGFRCSHNAAFL